MQRNARNATDVAERTQMTERTQRPLLSLRFGRCVRIAFVTYFLALLRTLHALGWVETTPNPSQAGQYSTHLPHRAGRLSWSGWF